ncbi:ABC transporter ATP-binding protein [Oscillatoria amoena NRMC-F 0135]|nr:ABC transporter ATP-binding protein [Oscillatoria amoena NRMC-F 0135]
MARKQIALLSATNLDVGYSARTDAQLFASLNISLLSGELVCFMGPNGVGKSTLIRTLAGLQKPHRGTITFSQSTPSSPTTGHVDQDTSRHIAVVLTDKIAAGTMTAEELITYGRYPYLDWTIHLTKTDETSIRHAMEATHVMHLKNKKLYELSDGQLQMVMIARALAQETPIILLDEPTAHLDLNNRVEIMNLLRRTAREKGKAILVATHELDLALQTADLIWLAGGNRNLLKGIPEDLVLNGSFDTIFQLKGFDLRTGKVKHEPWRNLAVNLVGEGPEYLWTKNALERCGFIVNNGMDSPIRVINNNVKPVWSYQAEEFMNLSDLLQKLNK